MKPTNLILAFTPLLLFTLVGHLVGPGLIGWVALTSAAIALLLLLVGIRRGVKLVTAASVAVFSGLAVAALLTGSSGQQLLRDYGSGVCALVIGAIMLVSVPTVPFTEQYARAQVPRQYWTTPHFIAVNKKISLAWAGAVTGIGISRLVYAVLDQRSEQVEPLLSASLNWGIPVVLVLIALRATKQAAATAHRPISPDPGE